MQSLISTDCLIQSVVIIVCCFLSSVICTFRCDIAESDECVSVEYLTSVSGVGVSDECVQVLRVCSECLYCHDLGVSSGTPSRLQHKTGRVATVVRCSTG